MFSFINNGYLYTSLKDHFEISQTNQISIKSSGSWNLINISIFIDDSDPNFNWSKTANENDWCSGTGTWIDPYTIENLTIISQNPGNCIEIRNSNAPFIIQNSTINLETSDGACIRLDNVDNGKVINNNCSGNTDNGIRLDSSNNITILGNNISGITYQGIRLSYSHNNKIIGNYVKECAEGFYLSSSNHNVISNNTLNNNTCGIEISFSQNNTLTKNNFTENNSAIHLGHNYDITLSENLMNFCGITLYGLLAELLSLNIYDNNLVNNKPVYYYTNKKDLGPSNFTDAGQIILINCSESIISGVNISSSTTGIYLGYSNNTILSNNNVNNNRFCGIHIYSSENNLVSEINAYNNIHGILLEKVNNHLVSEVNVYNNSFGINVGESNTINLFGNTVYNNSDGVALIHSDNITVMGNSFSYNEVGIYLDFGTQNSKIFLNSFTQNYDNAYDYGINNQWDNGTIGNYWDNYKGVDANNDGIGDTPYTILGTAGSQDNFPIWDDGDQAGIPRISFGNYYIMFTILSLFLIILKKKKEL